MTTKKIKTSDILGDNYYIYELTSSNYTPALNGTITITCTMKDVYGAVAGSKSITLYQNGVSKGAQTTNSSGVATWSITCSTAGLQKFNIKDTSIEVFVDNKSDVGHTHSQYLTEHQSLTNYVTTSDSRLSDARTPTAHATSATTYGVSSASDYGHAMASSTSPKANGTAAVGSETAKFARGDHVHPHSCVNDLTSTSTTTPLAANQGKVLNEKKLEKTTDTSLGTDIYETISSDTMCQDGWIIENGLQSTFAYITTTNTTVTMNNAEVEMRYQNNGKRSVKLQYTVSRTGQSDYTANEIISPGEKSNARFITYSEPSGGGDSIDDTVDWSAIYYYDVISITYTVSVTYRKINSVADIVYPIGSIYTSTNDIPPIALFGGRWEQLKDRFLLGSGDTYTNGTTGGSATVSLTQSQMPRHNHTTNAHTHNVSESGEYFVTSEANGANNTRVSYNASGNRYVDGMNDNKTPFHHRTTTGSASPTTKYTGGSGTSESASNGSAHENMPPYLVVYMWKRIA